MDITIEQKKSPTIRRYLMLAGILIPAFFGAKYLVYLGQSDFSVDRDSIVFDAVKRGNYTVSVRGSGLLVPDNIEWLSATFEAKVEKLIVKAGNIVKEGDLIVLLSNPQLERQLAEAKWELEALEAEVRAERVAQESALQQQISSTLNAKIDYEIGVNEFNARSELIETGATSRLEYNRARLAKDQLKQRWKSNQDQLKKMEENLVAHNSARAARLNKSKKIFESIQQQVDDLEVKASMDSIVLEMPLEAGQRVMMGANIAKLAQQDSLIAELQIPEIQIREVAIGQKVIIDTRNNKIEGLISRIDPAVVNGNVQVDVNFIGELPDDARPDLSVNGEIKVAEIEDALYVSRPLFAQSRSQTSFYKISEDGQFAKRVEVELGHGSVNQIQIVKGLKRGDRIVTSDPSRFESYEMFRIN